MREKSSDSEILSALNNLPRGLPETFHRLLEQQTTIQDAGIAERIFRWVAVAKRPLTLEKLREAISIVLLQKTWDPRALINNIKRTLGYCGNLVIIDEELETVHFTHSSVRQYLVTENLRKNHERYSLDADSAEEEVGAACVTYLNFPHFDQRVARVARHDIAGSDVVSTVMKNSLTPTANQIALRLIRKGFKSDKSINRLLEEAAEPNNDSRKQRSLEEYKFLPYAKNFWLFHTKSGIYPDSGHIWDLWCNLVHEAKWRDTLSSIPWTPEDLKNNGGRVADWIVAQNHCTVAHLFLSMRSNADRFSYFKDVVLKQHTQLAKFCLSQMNSLALQSETFLRKVAHDGDVDWMKCLLQAGVGIESRDWMSCTPLHLAARQGHFAIVSLLIQSKADINTCNKYGRTALHEAAERGHAGPVEHLIEGRTDINASDNDQWTALHYAASYEHKFIIDRLLNAGANIDLADEYWSRALHGAARIGDTIIVEKLLQAGANTDLADKYGNTALHEAARKGYVKVVTILLHAGAVVNAISRSGETPIQLARVYNHRAVISMLSSAITDKKGI